MPEPIEHNKIETSSRSSTGKAAGRLREAKSELRSKASREATGLKSKASETAEKEKQVAAGKIHAVARALREAGDALDRDGEIDLARWGREAADQVERVAGYLDRKDLSGLAHDLEHRARDNPGAFVGGTFTVGLMIGRFLRSSHVEPDLEQKAESRRELYGEPSPAWEEGLHG
jgi:hypothetical protein